MFEIQALLYIVIMPNYPIEKLKSKKAHESEGGPLISDCLLDGHDRL
jgi:hypothetical protein